MNHDKARQVDPTSDREDAGKWRYTSANNGKARVTGGCVVFGPCEVCKDDHETFCDTCWNSRLAVVGTCPGHDTAEEANAHHKTYMLDNRLELDRKMSNQMLKCQICKEYTEGMAYVGEWEMYILCDEHRTREVVEGLYQVGESWHS